MTTRGRPTFICLPDTALVVAGQDCKQVAKHTPRPAGYIEQSEWADKQMAAGRKQQKCRGCGRYEIWTP